MESRKNYEIERKRSRCLAAPIKTYIEPDGYGGLPDITVEYYYEELIDDEKWDEHTLIIGIEGFHVRTFKFKQKGLEGLCYGVDEFKKTAQPTMKESEYINLLPDNFRNAHFTPDYIVAGMSQEEVISELKEELRKRKMDNLKRHYDGGSFIGEIFEEEEWTI